VDGFVNVLDMTLVRGVLDQTGIPGWIREEVNNDGEVNVQDLMIVEPESEMNLVSLLMFF
jgi:hypothetical protein